MHKVILQILLIPFIYTNSAFISSNALASCILPGPTHMLHYFPTELTLNAGGGNSVDLVACEEIRIGARTYAARLGRVHLPGLDLERGEDGNLEALLWTGDGVVNLGPVENGLCANIQPKRCGLVFSELGYPEEPTWHISLHLGDDVGPATEGWTAPLQVPELIEIL